MTINIELLPVTLLNTAVDQDQADSNTLAPITVVEIVGDIDTNTAPLAQERILPLAQPEARMILEMTNVPYMSSAGLRMLLSLYRQLSAKGGQIILVGLSEEIQDTMSMTGFLDFFQTRNTLDEALETFNIKVQVKDT
ncbi:STAS domain-containing protein [Nostoc sp. ChiVER01]|uniref:STAS domain-containing protein n=1 Tax=Nostoc sp. ChiVER01 TaxID=3075382 RepID=UPI002AD3897F|nr:STAS domain-containing protein [Nostoc sp. ChiVER01]MDZ8225094.1 STAS domain-containing protein [Nostoc sp. ChiVER01]